MAEKISFKEILKNLLYSFMSFALPTAVLQFLIQPLIANTLGAELNGQYLTIMSFHYFMVSITSTVLNNVRLLQQKEYDTRRLRGDFNLYLIIYALISLIAVPIAWYCITGSLNVADIALMEVIALLYIYHDYIFAEYRLKLQYNKIFINNILMSVGYVGGWFLFTVTNKWQLVFITAYILPTVYDLLNTTLIKEPAKRTPLFKETSKKIATLTCSRAIGSVPSYCDKLILYPILGGTSVSIYYCASLVGKMILLVSSPLNSVLLSYLVKITQLDKKSILKKLPLVLGVVLAAYVVCTVIGYPLISFLYPQWAEQTKYLIPLTVAISIFHLISGLLNTMVLRFCKISYQVALQIISLVTYLVLSFTFLSLWGLWGFCIGSLLASAIKACIPVFLLLSKKTKNEVGE